MFAIAVLTNVAIFRDSAPSSPYVNRRFGGMYHLHLRDRKSDEQETSVYQVARQYGLHGDLSQKM
jgi:hypothetical protein